MNLIKVEEYSRLKAMKVSLEQQMKDIEDEVVAEVLSSGKKTLPTALGSVTISQLTSYKYSDKVIKLEEKYKKLLNKAVLELKPIKENVEIAKFTEQEKGIAEPIIKYSVSAKLINK